MWSCQLGVRIPTKTPVASRSAKAQDLCASGFVLVKALVFCSNGFNRKHFIKVFLPLHSPLVPLVSSPLVDPSAPQFNRILFGLRAALAMPANVQCNLWHEAAIPPKSLRSREVLWPCLSSWAFCLLLDIEKKKHFAFEAHSDLWSQPVIKVGGDNKNGCCKAPLFLSQQ